MEPNSTSDHSADMLFSMASLKISTFTYRGWKEDFQAMIQSQMEDEYFGDSLRFGQSNTMTRDRFLGMINKQRLDTGDRTHSQIVLLDNLRSSLTYPGWQADVEHAEKLHVRFPSLFQDQVSGPIVILLPFNFFISPNLLFL